MRISIDTTSDNSDNLDDFDQSEARDIYYYISFKSKPDGLNPTSLPGEGRSPPVTPFKLKKSPEVPIKPKKTVFLFRDYLRICLAILSIILLLTSIALLILSILTPSFINSVFAPILNILQTQIISGFGIIAGGILGVMQIKYHYNDKRDDCNDNVTVDNYVY